MELYKLLLQAQYNSAQIAKESLESQKEAFAQQAQTLKVMTDAASRYKRTACVGAVGTGVGAFLALCSWAINIYQAYS